MGYEVILEDLVNYQNGNRVIQTWSLSETIFGLAIVLSVYLALVVKILPSFMKQREPYKLKSLLLFYNCFQVAFSAYLVFIYSRYILSYGVITKRCPKGEDLQAVIKEIYPYFIAKHLDLLDTVFFVLRKKDNQVTFLHLYHHNTMVTWTWLHLMYHPADHFVVVGMLNSFVHVLMYAYYGISSLGPKYAKFVWWKKHLTKVQLVQFVLVTSHLHYQQKLTPCPLPTFFHYFCVSLICSFFLLFMKFYVQSYRVRKERKANDLNVGNKLGGERLLKGL
ncbi:elongation of very long chain fatty acids protein 4 isoform X1 [Bombyx mori]|uniref:Elongation of very long chain fatty acids protein n=1 Tax=Bombyx mori TaxID=7091 RepID=A0A8R1WPU1_BOMMO|nr:elongation of very long chain fatty acids protein 4 isoform X2 [Bombyx mori]